MIKKSIKVYPRSMLLPFEDFKYPLIMFKSKKFSWPKYLYLFFLSHRKTNIQQFPIIISDGREKSNHCKGKTVNCERNLTII